MRTYFTSGTTGVSKHVRYTSKELGKLGPQMKLLMEEFEVDKSDKVLNSFSLFPSHAPNLGFWQGTQIGDYEHINHFDVGSLPLEKVIPMMKAYKPAIIMGDANTLLQVLTLFSKEELSELRAVISGNNKPDKNLNKFVEEQGAALGSIYGRTENALIMYTEKGKWEEGYLIDKHKIDFNLETNEMTIDGEATGDKGFINKYGKLDLDIERIKEGVSICADSKNVI